MSKASLTPRPPKPAAGSAPNPVPMVHRFPAHLARRFHQICLGVLMEVTEPEALTPLQYGVVASLDELPGIGQRGLAARLGIDPVSAGQLIDELEGAGLVDRRVDPDDRRARVLRLTPTGAKLRRRLRPAMVAAHDRILAPLAPDERATLLALLTRVIEGNDAYARPGNGRRKPRRTPPPTPKE